jgi:hypothetical protein
MSLPFRRILLLATCLVPSALVMAQQPAPSGEDEESRKPMNLSLPREASSPAAPASREVPDARRPSIENRRFADDYPPYGTGFEARRRELGGGIHGGFGRGRGGGRGR